MSVESARLFLKKFGTDSAFRKSIEDASNDKEKQSIVNNAGFDFTKNDLRTINKEEIKNLGNIALPQSSGTWVGVGTGTAAGAVGAGAGVAAAVTAGASASAAV